ncbi:MAG TPA: chemotaxis protein CheW [Terriglobales bacterium]|nr:chemotaxis protein CheW [Terriglobales bacterium]
MSAAQDQFVLFPLGKKRFALPAERVTELARMDLLHEFPSNTPLVNGVLVRRGELIPVCDVAQVLVGADAPVRKFYLIAKRKFEKAEERSAIPVSGDCELTSSKLLPPTGKLATYVAGLLSLQEEIVEVIDLEKVMSEVAQ